MTVEEITRHEIPEGKEVSFTFELPAASAGERVGFGGWFCASETVEVEHGGSPARVTVTTPGAPDWGKIGSQWVSDGSNQPSVRVTFRAPDGGFVALYQFQCGVIEHEHYDNAREELLGNMHSFSPEANLYDQTRVGNVHGPDGPSRASSTSCRLYLKSCNRCGRFLPVNVNNERAHLSFSNHCVADHRRPCEHSGFGRIRDSETGEDHELEYGFQLECRFCKKFEVNAAHNPQRTTAQMKEDAQRRRAFELLLEHLYEGSDQLRYRHRTGSELAEDIYERFDGECFKCGTSLATPGDMHLDHTRPLALLWPLDETATALCPTCNSEKRDRPPADFYTEDELQNLAAYTGLSVQDLKDPSPNLDALELLRERADWFCDEFLQKPELQDVRDGKRTADLLIKALDKALARTPGGVPFRMRDLCDGVGD